MPKDFASLNYYEMLDIKPGAAPFEIRQGYNNTLQIYGSGSIASYSFFSEAERKNILALIEKAYHTLINDQARKEYHDGLVREGVIDAVEEMPAAKKTVAVFSISRGPTAQICASGKQALKDKIAQNQIIAGILAQNELCGTDLKKIRTELAVPIEQIAQETKIRVDHLQSMEEDHFARLPAAVFLKGFVKSYLQSLGLEPSGELAARYMENIARLSQSKKT